MEFLGNGVVRSQLKQSSSVSEYFTVDRKGDSQNILYGQSQHGSPRFHATGYGHVLGLGGRYKRSRITGHVEIEDPDAATRTQRPGKSLASGFKDASEPLQKVKSPNAQQFDSLVLQDNFVPLKAGRKRHRNNLNLGLGHKEVDSDQQSSVEAPSTNDSEAEPDDPFESFKKDPQRQKLIELERLSRQQPTNLSVWLQLVEHHESLSKSAQENAQSKVHVFERALGHVKVLQHREKLLLGLLQEYSKVGDTQKLASTWKWALRESRSTALRSEYLNFKQSDFQSFRVDDFLTICIDTIHNRIFEAEQPRNEVQIYVILRTTNALRQAGYTERAIAIWQAVLEYSIHVSMTQSALGNASSDFDSGAVWESQKPRIGEDSSRSRRLDGDSQRVSNRSLHAEECSTITNKYEAWAYPERESNERFFMPARLMVEDAGDDPFRIVMFADVKDFLLRVDGARGLDVLLNAFVLFCSLPLLPTSPESTRKWMLDPFARILTVDVSGVNSNGKSRAGSGFQSFPTDTMTLYADPSLWFSAWSNTPDTHDIDPAFVQRCLHQLVERLPRHTALAEYAIAYELTFSPTTARKYAKSLCKSRTDSLQLYNAYAMVEARLGKNDAAEKVWATALSLRQTLPASQKDQIAMLWRSWIWTSLERGERDKATRLLLSVPNNRLDLPILSSSDTDSPKSNVQSTLRSRRHLENELQQCISSHQYDNVVNYTDLLALLNYLTSTDSSLKDTRTIFNQSLVILSTQRNAPRHVPELLHQALARHIHYHITHSHVHRAQEISEILTASLEEYPDNTIFLSLHQTHFSTLDRLRTILPSLSRSHDPKPEVTSTPSPIRALHAITMELSRSPSFGGSTTHSIRASFHHALLDSDAPLRHSPALWQTYLQWESAKVTSTPNTTSHKNLRRHQTRLRDLLHQSLQRCPWSKDLYLLAFTDGPIRSAIEAVGGQEELQTLYESMLEKGIRVRHELEE